MIDHTGQVARPEAVVDVHHADPAGTGVQHGQQGGYPMERGAVAHAGGYRNHRTIHQPANNAGQGPFHTGNGNDHPGLHQLFRVGEQPVEPRHPHVIEPFHLVAQSLGSLGRLLRHRDVAGAAGGHHNKAVSVGFR